MSLKKMFFVLFVTLIVLIPSVQAAEITWTKTVVSDRFHSEGAAFGDFNKDGVDDIVCGHVWYEGPEFTKKHLIYNGKDYDPTKYSNSFVVFVDDFNQDGWDDVLICPHPGTTGSWYENPKGKETLWSAHETTVELGNESQFFVDMDGDGSRDLVFNRNNWYGYITRDRADVDAPWKFVPISTENKKYTRYFHGVGVGDINGDGRPDMLEQDGWWEQPSEPRRGAWSFHPFKFSPMPSYLLVSDFDGDGLNDVFTTTHCHQYGLVWYRQIRDDDGTIHFEKTTIIPDDPAPYFFPRVSQMHAMTLADMNHDGVMDVVTGKRWWAHGPNKDACPNDPAVLMWWETRRKGNGQVEFFPHIIDYDCGVGTQVTCKDINADQIPDILIGNKKGTRLLLSGPAFPNKKRYGDITEDEWNRYQSWCETLPAEERDWESRLQANMGGFYFFPYYLRTRLSGKITADQPGAWGFVRDDPSLPRVLLIGDSISIGYTPETRVLLQGKANVHRAPCNCGPTDSCLQKLPGWLGTGKWDLIHFNFGIHDRAKTPEQYQENLQKIVNELKKTGATLVFATTTPFRQDGKLSEKAEVFNRVACEMMKKENIALDDLNETIRPNFESLVSNDGVHYKPAGKTALAVKVAATIEENLLQESPKK